ncbi:hypothetical protein [Paenibacillus illinoisensis]|uniref:hypothetical protein n=1 Tax=Paenibacillus illinoisensis TaxID=59845 RepID=UPI001580F674|nr:hypothetical protein [Paenibacillus illinoisensis]
MHRATWIQHSVIFTLKHDEGSEQKRQFLDGGKWLWHQFKKIELVLFKFEIAQ